MALDRQSIEKKDFPLVRRGYDTEAVDAHLASVASQAEERGSGLASAASERVSAVISAAEQTAAEIEAQAREEARRIRAEADAERREQTVRVSELASALKSLRDGVGRVTAEIDRLEASVREAAEEHEPEPRRGPPAVEGAAPAGEPAIPDVPATPAAEPPPPAPEPADAEPAAPPAPDPVSVPPVPGPSPVAAEPAPAAVPTAKPADSEGARLVALNMALGGSSREEVDAYLAGNFDLPDRATLLDQVYAAVGR